MLFRLRRIRRFEKKMTELRRLISGKPTPETISAAKKYADALSRYYSSKAWKRDFAADEAGLLPKDLPRGVLSEDGVYDLLDDYRAWAGGE